MPKPFVVAAVQAAPVFLDREATVDKACERIAEAARRGAKLVVLPEAFVPGYPAWVWTLPLARRPHVASLYRSLVENAVDVPGPAVNRLGEAARAAGVWVSIGVDERNAEASRTTLYNTTLLFDDAGRLVERRRKLMPTGAERMVWTTGEAVPLRVHDTPFGRLGSLICWENYMPLARYALHEQGEQVHLAPTWDKSEQWLASMRHIAREGRMFVISCCQAIHRDQIPDAFPFKDTLPVEQPWVNVGNSVIVDPDGLVIAGPVAEREEILLAEIDPGRATGLRWIFDAAGHYGRTDLFTFSMRGADSSSASGPAAAPAPRATKPARRAATRPKTTARRAGVRRKRR